MARGDKIEKMRGLNDRKAMSQYSHSAEIFAKQRRFIPGGCGVREPGHSTRDRLCQARAGLHLGRQRSALDEKLRREAIERRTYFFPMATRQCSISFAHTLNDIEETLKHVEDGLRSALRK
jgi:hypothetical protein